MSLQALWTSPALALLSLLLVLNTERAHTAVPCRNGECVCLLPKSIRLSKFMKKEADDLLKTYMDSQGDFSELFCQMPVNGVPDAEITGHGTLERLGNIYTKLGLFLKHITVVTEEQQNLQDPENPLFQLLADAKAHIGNLATNIKYILQALYPNDTIPEAAEILPRAPSRNVFQQKIHGCVVLLRHRDFLSHVLQELKGLWVKGHACTSRAE
ncbi:IL-6 subfamily cytokine M17 [Megalops cyprinoides]|uniref:IL-6 subfamily cytokine M17 n=1 Tax=Megalops cyprinoides TaxID=118141 RepID=UPI0018640798|nr:IL-6 subfamily cytokine M17 [Megalops cyprinoides]